MRAADHTSELTTRGIYRRDVILDRIIQSFNRIELTGDILRWRRKIRPGNPTKPALLQ
jgi:hypothetical protein